MGVYRLIDEDTAAERGPWRGAVGIEVLEDGDAAPATVCWFARDWGDLPGCIVSLLNARWVIRAMREPTPAMVLAGEERGRLGPDEWWVRVDDIWRAMIDAALGEAERVIAVPACVPPLSHEGRSLLYLGGEEREKGLGKGGFVGERK